MGLISIIVPVSSRVNSQVLHIQQLEKLASIVDRHDFEFIFVGDVTHKDALSLLEEKIEGDKRYRIITLTRDFGSKASFLAGITYASGDCVGYFSSSNLDPCQIFEKLIQYWESGAKVVLGKWDKFQSRASIIKGLNTRKNYLRNSFISSRIDFLDVSSLLIDKDAYYLLSQITDPFSDIIETLAWTGFQFHLVEYSYQNQGDVSRNLVFKEQTLNLDISPSLNMPKTIQTSLSIGLFLIMLGGLSFFGLEIAREYYEIIIPEWWLFASIGILIGGIQLALMSVLGEQLYKSLLKIRSRPVYVVESIINPPISSKYESREKLEKMILSLWSVRKQKSAYGSSLNSNPADEDPG